MEQARVFLSAVSSEFKSAREGLAHDLRSAGFHVEEQDTFVQRGGAPRLLRKLHDYIRECFAVVCLVGERTGAYPQPPEVAEFPDLLPVAAASYTQWEYFLARHFDRGIYVYVADDKFSRDQPGPADPAQAEFIAYLVSDGIDRTPVSDAGSFHTQVLAAMLRDRDAGTSKPAHQPIVLPYPSLGSLFKGRDGFLRDLRTGLTRRGGAAAIVSDAVLGTGGIGKTRAAVEYAWANRRHYKALLQVTADTPDTLDANLAALAAPLRLAEAGAAETDVKKNAVLAWLCANPGWLLILDNADTEAARDAVIALLGRLDRGHVLVTSRLERSAWHDMGPIDLDVLATPDAAAFLLEATEGYRVPHPDDAPQAAALAEELGGLALALDLAAATIRQRQCSLADYTLLWRDARDKVKGWNRKALTGYHSAVGQTWQTSVAQVSPTARVLLERLAFLAPEPVPGFLLDVPVPEADPLDAREALLELAAYSLVTRQAAADRFSVHRLVQDATRRGLDDATRRQRVTEAAGWVNAAWVGDAQDARDWPRLEPLVPHAEAVALAADRAGIAEPTGRLMNDAATLLQQRAQFARAEPLNFRALELAEAQFDADHPEVAIHLNNLAHLCWITNRLGQAEPLLRRALAILEQAFGPDHPEVASSLNALAVVLDDTNRGAEAEPLYRRALAIDEAKLGDAHPQVAVDLTNLGLLLGRLNRPAEAEPLLRRAVMIDEAHYGRDDPQVAMDLTNLAWLLNTTGRVAEAEPLRRRVLAIDEAQFGPAHPSVARSLNNLGVSLYAQRRYAEAEPLYRRALAIDEANFGADHPAVARDLTNLGLLLCATGRAAEAEPLLRRAVVILLRFQRDTGHAHPDGDQAIENYIAGLTDLGCDQATIEAALADAAREAGLG
jgi:tetratricopeptide (TPR) repeat protein